MLMPYVLNEMDNKMIVLTIHDFTWVTIRFLTFLKLEVKLPGQQRLGACVLWLIFLKYKYIVLKSLN